MDTASTGQDTRARNSEKKDTSSTNGWCRSFENIRREHGFETLEVEGRLPAELAGTLYRNGPGLVSLFGDRYQHWFDGDGAINALRIEGGRASGAVRICQTQGLLEERSRGKRYFGTYGTRPPGFFNPVRLVRTLLGRGKNPANTSVLLWNDRLFALCEAGRPFEIDPENLRSIGETTLDGAITGGFSAHPHRIAKNGFIYNVGVQIGRPQQLSLFELRPEGTARRAATVPLAHGTMIHDFALTETHAVVFVHPLQLRVLPTLLGREPFNHNLAWDGRAPSEVLVFPLDAPERVIRFEVPSFWVWHVGNAFDRGGELVLDLVHYPDYPASANWLEEVTQGVVDREQEGRLTRTVIDPKKQTLTHEVMTDRTGEFPRVAPRCEGGLHNTIFWCENSSPTQGRTGPPDTLARFDIERGETDRFHFDAHLWPSEGVFIPRSGPDRKEDDGFLIAQVYDARVHRSGWSIFDARGLADGPLASVWLDQHLPLGFHGTFRAS